jgi:hypothetical protein
MKHEERTVKVSFFVGVSEIVLALIMTLTGWHIWWYDHFHFFGVFGLASLVWAFWHDYFYYKDVGRHVWEKKDKN